MVALALDTHALVKELKAAGFDDRQAEAVTHVFTTTREAFDLATKTDLRELEMRLEAKIESVKYDIVRWTLGAIGFQTVALSGTVTALVKMAH